MKERSIKYREYWKKYHQDKRAERRANGLCLSCGKSDEINENGWCDNCRKKTALQNREASKKRRAAGLCHKCTQPAMEGFTHCERHRHETRQRWRDYRQKVLEYYGRSCACCGETIEEFLCIDHINGGGIRHKKELGARSNGSGFYKWLIDQGFPEGYQVLCHNCNMAKGFYGKCPHENLKD